MNTKHILSAAIFALLGTAAMAQSADVSNTQRPLTRAEVQAELARAIADGSINRLHDSYGFSPDVKAGPTSSRTREEVRAEAREAARSRAHVAVSYGS